MSSVDNETMSLLAECEDCKAKFKITSGEAAGVLSHKKEFKVNGTSIFLTFYDCPYCGRSHYVQIDDAYSLNLLKDVSRQFVKLAVAKKKEKEIPQKQSAKFNKSRKHLSDYRMKLMKQYTGKLIHNDETDSDFVLRFSV